MSSFPIQPYNLLAWRQGERVSIVLLVLARLLTMHRYPWRAPQCDSCQRKARCTAWSSNICPTVTRWPNSRNPLHQCRVGLPWCRTGTFLFEGQWTCRICRCNRRRGLERIPSVYSTRGHHPRYVSAITGLRFWSPLALESSHALWEGIRRAKTLPKETTLVIVRILLPFRYRFNWLWNW